MTDPTPFVPIIGPPSHYDTLATGLSTEKGDSAMTMVQKINAGFEHVYSVLRGGAKAVAPSTVLADIDARLKAAEATLAAVPHAAAVDLSVFVQKSDLAAMQSEMKALEALVNRAINLILNQPPSSPPPPPPG